MPINATFPLPQANRLDRVAAVVDVIAAGATSVPDIAQVLDVGVRQGSYYAAAAGYLGLVEKASTFPRTYSLTDAGRQVLAADAHDRAALVLDAVGDMPQVDIYLAQSLPGVSEHYQATGLDPATALRRATTVASWTAAATAPDLPAALATRTAALGELGTPARVPALCAV